MALTPSIKQKQICEAVANAIKSDHLEAAVHGAAGTGKTTCVPYIIEQLQDLSRPQFVCAPTNKAAGVLRDKLGGIPVNTIHRIVNARPIDKNKKEREEISAEIANVTSKESFSKKEAFALITKHEQLRKEKLKTTLAAVMEGIERFAKEFPGAILHIDEASMVDGAWRQCLRNAGIQCVYTGDQHQLPPVDGEDWFAEAENAYELTENFRQMGGSQIIEAALMVRNSEDRIDAIIDRLQHGGYAKPNSDVSIMNYYDVQGFYKDLANNSDQVIAYRSNMKIKPDGNLSTKICIPYLNSRIREAIGIYSPMPVEGEPVVLNEHFIADGIGEWYVGDTLTTKSAAKFLGIDDMPVTWSIKNLTDRLGPQSTYSKGGRSVVMESGAFLLDLIHEDGEVIRNVAVDPIMMRTQPLRMQTALNERIEGGDPAARCLRVEYAYSINGHQSQGSEYDRVSVFLERGFLKWVDGEAIKKKTKLQSRRWIYTALTRAKNKLNMIFPPNYS